MSRARPIDVSGKTEIRMFTKEIATAMNNATRFMVKEVTQEVAMKAKKYVPKRTHKLEESIRGTARKERGGNRFIGTIQTGPGANGFKYGALVELGTPTRRYKNTPYMRPAFRETMPDVHDILQRAAEKEAAKQKRKRGRPRKTG